MYRIWATLAALLLAVALGGCDWIAQKELQPGVSTVDDVRRLMGKPEMIWEENDGSQVLEYARGPEGHQTFMVEIGADRKYRGMREVLVQSTLARVTVGMSRDDVRRLLGKPTEVSDFPARSEQVWSWRYRPQPQRSEFFNAHFGPDGRVVSTSATPDSRSVNTGG